MFTVKENTSGAALIGYQNVFGGGLGLAFQLPSKSKSMFLRDCSQSLNCPLVMAGQVTAAENSRTKNHV
jgi:hypothetical protein